jgi:hypothetical protein
MKLVLIAAAAGLSLTALSADLTSTYAKGEIRTTQFSYEESSSLVDVEMLMNGEEGPMGAPDMEMEMETVNGQSGVFADTITRGGEGKPAGFLRLYSDLELHSSMSMRSSMFDDQDSEESKESELEGVSVAFAFEDGEYTAEFPGEEAADKEVLAGLEALLPWASLLPEEGVEVEAEWEIDAEAFAGFFDLGGDLAWDSEGNNSEGNDSEGNDDEDAQESEVEGTVTATLTKIEDGEATISISFELSELVDLTGVSMNMGGEEPDDVPEGMMMPDMIAFTIEKESEGEGTAIWNIEGGYLSSLELECEFTSVQEMIMVMEMGPETMEMEEISTSEGEATFSVQVTVERE